MAEEEPDAVVRINTVIKNPEELAAIRDAVPPVIREIVNPELVLDPLGTMPFRAADIPVPDLVDVDIDEDVIRDQADIPEIEPPAAPLATQINRRKADKKPKPPPPDPDRYLMAAKQAVVDNYNSHRDGRRSPELSMDTVYIVMFSKTLSNWKALVASPIVRGLMWEVTHNGIKKQTYLDIYKKINNVTLTNEDNS